MWKAIRKNIFVGLILVTPLAVTAVVANWLFKVTTNQFVVLFPDDTNIEFLLRIAALLIVLFILFMIGVLARNFIGRSIYKLGDSVLTRIPFISRIYLASRQVIDAFITQRETVFSQAVLVEYPRKGVFAMGFQTATAPNSFRQHIPLGKPGDDWVAVFIPTTPNPTSGWLVYVAKEDVTPLPQQSGDMMKCIISAGVVYPEEGGTTQPQSLVDKLHNIFRKEPPAAANPAEPQKSSDDEASGNEPKEE